MKLSFILILAASLNALASGFSQTVSLSATPYARQGITVSGTVADNSGPLPGVNVTIKGTTTGVVTDSNGKYTISVPNADAVLIFSFVGYAAAEMTVGDRREISVTLSEDTKEIEEVVVVGYGIQKKATVTGSVTSVQGDKLMAVPTTNLTNSIVGRLPGLVVVTRSGEPGSDGGTLRVRGTNTLGDNSPLIVVDGIANRSLERLNAADIQSITVLKDASAAIYGAQAANGVILVTTKRGAQGKPKASFIYNEGRSMPTVIPKSIDAATYMEMLNEINYYAGAAPKYTGEEINNFRTGSDPWKYPNTDWYAETFQKTAAQRDGTLTISGGQEKLTYFISAGAKYQDGIYKNSATHYKQANFRINLDGRFNDYVKYGIDVSGLQNDRSYPTRSAGDIFTMLRRGKPNMPAYWPNGKNGPDIEYGNNPVVVTTNQTGYDKNVTYSLLGSAKLDVSIPWVKGLTVSGNAAFDRNIKNDKLWRLPWYLYNWDGVTYGANGVPELVEGKKGLEDPELTQNMEDANMLTLNALVNYSVSIQNTHNVKILFGTERISGETMDFEAFRKYFVSTAIDQLFAGGDAEKNNTGKATSQARLNYFGRANYDYLGKYLFEFVWRYDGSYIFPKDTRFGFFPGVSLGWRISEEDFWKNNLSTFNHFKIRGSWGQTGNDRIDPYQYLASYGFLSETNQIYTFNTNVEKKVLNELRIPNTAVTWEVANQSNIGFDGQMLSGKLTFEADYFYNVRSNILWRRNASVPASSGLSLPMENIGKVANRGFEFQVSYADRIGDFHYEAGVNLNFNKSKIQFWDETPGIPDYQKSTGYPLDPRYYNIDSKAIDQNVNLYYQAIGIFKDQPAVDAYPHWTGARPGDVIFRDVNEDGKIDGLDRIREHRTELPTHTGGLNIDLSYKNIYLSAFFQWATGAVRYDYYEMQGEVGNFLKRDVEGRWTESNPNASQPRIWNRYAEYWRNNRNTYWLQSSDYVRLKNLEIGYRLPSSFTSKLHMEGIRIYFTGMNLFTLTKIKDFDPETTSATAYPLNTVYNIGINLNF